MTLPQVCVEANSGKTITTEGYLTLGGSLFCSGDRSGNVRCGLYALAAPGEVDFNTLPMGVRIVQGTGANQIEPVERGFRAEDLVIRDAQGNRIDVSQPVQVTGRMLIGEKSCSMDADEMKMTGVTR
jgi:hypothetical protein